MRLMSLCVTAEQRPRQSPENGVFQSSPRVQPTMGACWCHKTLPGEPAGLCEVELDYGRGSPNPTRSLPLSF